MSKYNLIFKLDKIDADNEFIATTIVGYDAKALPLKNIRKLLKLAIKQAEDLEESSHDNQ